MFPGYMQINGVELMNVTRTKAYVDSLAPGIKVTCSTTLLRTALGHAAYVSPTADSAPWYRSADAATGKFYGVFPVRIQGADDSTQEIDTTELISDGGVHVSPRHKVREIRVTAVAIALDDEGMAAGLAWLRDVLANDGCRDGVGCYGRVVKMFNAAPETTGEASSMARWFYNVEVQEGPKVTKVLPSHVGAMVHVEFTLAAGVPWMFTTETTVATLAMNGASNFTDPVGENCSIATEAYTNFINDPFYTGISQPPQAPTIVPPNILTITSWRRLTATIAAAQAVRPGRPVPVITVVAASTATQYIRLRFYRADAGVDGCDYVGEFFIAYLPGGSTMTIDGRTKQIFVTLSDGRVVPGGHLLYGSAGRPFQWPNMSCDQTYTMTADMFPGQTNISVTLKAAVRE